jgi:hypothetical protein
VSGDADGNNSLSGPPKAAANAMLAESLDLQLAVAIGNGLLDSLLQDAGSHSLPVLFACNEVR